MVILDTDIIIDHLRTIGRKESIYFRFSKTIPKENQAISLITIQELFQGSSTRNIEQEKSLVDTVAPLKILPYTYQIAKLAGQINRDVKNTIDFADATIAATCIINEAKLFTLNKKDFRDIKDLSFYSLT